MVQLRLTTSIMFNVILAFRSRIVNNLWPVIGVCVGTTCQTDRSSGPNWGRGRVFGHTPASAAGSPQWNRQTSEGKLSSHGSAANTTTDVRTRRVNANMLWNIRVSYLRWQKQEGPLPSECCATCKHSFPHVVLVLFQRPSLCCFTDVLFHCP